MTTCRTPQSGGVSGTTARSADKTRIDSPASRGTRTQLPPMPPRPRWRVPAAQLPPMPARPRWRVPAAWRAQPPDYETLRRVRDGLKRL